MGLRHFHNGSGGSRFLHRSALHGPRRRYWQSLHHAGSLHGIDPWTRCGNFRQSPGGPIQVLVTSTRLQTGCSRNHAPRNGRSAFLNNPGRGGLSGHWKPPQPGQFSLAGVHFLPDLRPPFRQRWFGRRSGWFYPWARRSQVLFRWLALLSSRPAGRGGILHCGRQGLHPFLTFVQAVDRFAMEGFGTRLHPVFFVLAEAALDFVRGHRPLRHHGSLRQWTSHIPRAQRGIPWRPHHRGKHTQFIALDVEFPVAFGQRVTGQNITVRRMRLPVPDPFILRPAAIHPVPRDPEPGDVGSVPVDHSAALRRFTVPVHRKAELLDRDENITSRLDAAEFVDGGIVSHLVPVERLRRQGVPAHILIAPAPRHPGWSPDFARHPDPAASLQLRPTAVVIGGPAEGFIREPRPPAVAGRPPSDRVWPP